MKRPVFSKIADDVNKDKKKYFFSKKKKSKLDNSEVYFIVKENKNYEDDNFELEEGSEIDENSKGGLKEFSEGGVHENLEKYYLNESEDNIIDDYEEEKLKIKDYLLNESKSKTCESNKNSKNRKIFKIYMF